MIEHFISEHLLLIVIVLAFGILLLRQHRINSAPTYTASATIVSRRMEPARFHSKWSSGWNHLVTFQLGDGDTIELYTGEEEYHQLTEGLRGTLCWQNEDFRQFDSEE